MIPTRAYYPDIEFILNGTFVGGKQYTSKDRAMIIKELLNELETWRNTYPNQTVETVTVKRIVVKEDA